jgi:hypothetical protein
LEIPPLTWLCWGGGGRGGGEATADSRQAGKAAAAPATASRNLLAATATHTLHTLLPPSAPLPTLPADLTTEGERRKKHPGLQHHIETFETVPRAYSYRKILYIYNHICDLTAPLRIHSAQYVLSPPPSHYAQTLVRNATWSCQQGERPCLCETKKPSAHLAATPSANCCEIPSRGRRQKEVQLKDKESIYP